MFQRPVYGTETRLHWPVSLRRARLTLLLLIGCGLLAWHTHIGLTELQDFQRARLQSSAQGAAREISLLFAELRVRAQLFADSHRDDLLRGIADDASLSQRQLMQDRIHLYFPHSKDFLITDASGQVLPRHLNRDLSESCQAAVSDFLQVQNNASSLHPSNYGLHFDLLANLRLADGSPGVLFIHQSNEQLADLLAQRSRDGVSLLLAPYNAERDEAEIAPDAKVSAAALAQRATPALIDASHWSVIAIPDLERATAAQNAIYLRSGVLLLVFLLLLGLARAYRRAARARRKALELVNLASHSTGSLIWEWDLRNDHMYFPIGNGLAETELSGDSNSWIEQVHPEERSSLMRALEAHRRGERNALELELEHRFRGNLDEWRWLLIRSHIAEHDLAGEPSRAVGICTDITARKHDESRLHAAAERTQATLASIADGVISTDAEGRIDYINPVAEALTGYSLEHASGRQLHEIVELRTESDRELIDDPVEQCLLNGRQMERDDCLMLTHDQREFAVRLTAAPMRDPSGMPLGIVLAICDTTRARHRERRMLYHATHDPLTGLANRHQLSHRLLHAIDSAQRHQHTHVLCYLDLDHFQRINRQCGHLAGDAVLKQVAGVLGHRVRNRDTLARLSSDEFALLLENCPPQQGRSIARQIVQELAETPFNWQGRSFELTASLGVVMIDAYVENRNELLARAYAACQTAKDLGRNQAHLADPERQSEPEDKQTIHRAVEIRSALDDGRFELFAQPIVALSPDSDSRHHLEVLLRVRDIHGQLHTPQAFVSAAERYDLMPLIDRWVINSVLETCKLHPLERGCSDIEVSINLSGSSLGDDSLLDYVLELLGDGSPPGYQLCFEITETSAISNLASARHFMSEMQERGCRFALDDFGSGLSSFAYLKSLPVDYLKIDGGFVQHIDRDPIDRAMVAAIHQVGEIMGIPTVAEFVEREAQIADLRAIGVTYGQGRALGVPRPLGEQLSDFSAEALDNSSVSG